ncbi:sugar phosphate isomerase/epimerase family protein [Acidimangrovimonas sediminis]|uniref:sugar phosphate isomerase/epimerase family protein n=1 Tax=Acidimangrovimonas sediminis TaxID=2056283 RepID=UPI000C7FE6D7|nr:sugar phosphate isomerase/epimerase [Acidimangrovimonas sediminis]
MNRKLPPISMAYLTCQTLPPPGAVGLAEDLGYDAVGLRIRPAAPGGAFSPLIEDPALLRETRARLDGSPVTVFDVEIIRLDPGFRAASVTPFLEVCAALGARAVLVAGDDADRGRLTASFAAFCEAAAPFGLKAGLEFMPWTALKTARDALGVVEAAGLPNGTVLVDALHQARSDSPLPDIAAIPPERLCYAQICDAPPGIPDTAEEMIFTARSERLLPGEGGIDLPALFARLPWDLPVSVEIPSDSRVPKLGAREWARRALETTRESLTIRHALAGAARLG